MSLTFRGKHASTVAGGSLLINRVERALLPSRKGKFLKVAGKKGAYDYGTDKDMLQFNIVATLTARSILELEDKLAEVRNWLDGETGELVFDSRNRVSYYAKIEGDTSIEQLGTTAFIAFTFICPDPVGIGAENTFTKSVGESMIAFNTGGDDDTYPVTEIDIKSSTHTIILTNGDEHILLGKPAKVDQEDVANYDYFYADPTNPQALTAGVGVDNGDIVGDFASNGWSMRQKDYNFGTGTKWHGAAKVFSVPTPIQDFNVRANVGFTGSTGQVGRIEVYLLDENGVRFGKIGLVNNWKTAWTPETNAYIGGAGSIYPFWLLSGTPTPENLFSNFSEGFLQIGRVGRRWSAMFASTKNGLVEKMITRDVYVTDDDRHMVAKLGGIEFHMAQWADWKVASTMWFGTTYIVQDNDADGTLVGNKYSFYARDKIIVDHEKACVYRNGVPENKLISPSSSFFALTAGNNVIGVSHDGATDLDMTVKVKERYK